MIKQKSQISVEYLMIFGFVTLSVIIILGVALHYSASVKDSMRSTQINDFATKIIASSESVYYSGEPSKATISVYLPESVQNISIINNSMFIEYVASSGTNKIAYKSKVPLCGQLSVSMGVKNMKIEANETAVTLTEV